MKNRLYACNIDTWHVVEADASLLTHGAQEGCESLMFLWWLEESNVTGYVARGRLKIGVECLCDTWLANANALPSGFLPMISGNF